MPLLMTDVADGSSAARQIQQNELMRIYDAEAPKIKLDLEQAQARHKQLEVEQLQQTLAEDAELKDSVSDYVSKNPEATPVDALEQVSRLALGKSPKLAVQAAETAGKLRKQEAETEKAVQDNVATRLNNVANIARTLADDDVEGVQKVILGAHVNGFNSAQYINNLQQYGPKRAKELLIDHVEGQAAKELDRRIAHDRMLQNKYQEDQRLREQEFLRKTAREGQARQNNPEGLSVAERKRQDTITQDFSKAQQDAYKDYMKVFREAEAAFDKSDKTQEARNAENARKNSAAEAYAANIERLNTTFSGQYQRHDMPFTPLPVPGAPGLQAKVEKEESVPRVAIKVADGFTPNADQQQSLENALRAMEKRPDLEGQILQRLKAAGIKLRD